MIPPCLRMAKFCIATSRFATSRKGSFVRLDRFLTERLTLTRTDRPGKALKPCSRLVKLLLAGQRTIADRALASIIARHAGTQKAITRRGSGRTASFRSSTSRIKSAILCRCSFMRSAPAKIARINRLFLAGPHPLFPVSLVFRRTCSSCTNSIWGHCKTMRRKTGSY